MRTSWWWWAGAMAIAALGSCGPSQHVAGASRKRPAAHAVAPAAFDSALPTLRLPRNFVPTRYTARLAIDPALPTFNGDIAIAGTLVQPSAVIWLNANGLAIVNATAEVTTSRTTEVPLRATVHGEFLELRPDQPLASGPTTLRLTYAGDIERNGYQGAFLSKQGDDPYIITQFESTAARMVFPCLDEPDRKVPWQLTLDVPRALVAVSNTLPETTAPLDADHVRVAFAPTRPLPSYLVAFAVGPYEIIDAGKSHSGAPIRVLAPRGKAKEAALLASAEPHIVDFLEGWFGMPYPYPKLDLVIVPSARDLAMENAGMITLDARYTLLSNPLASDRYALISVAGHETAHQWFGDLVTAAWWDDIWLNESFATWMEDKLLAAYDASWPSEVAPHRAIAMRADALASTRKIHQPIDTADSIHNIFDAITYPKGAIVLRMLEHEVGPDAFQTAIRAYLTAHADGNARAADVFAAIDQAAGKPLGGLVTGYFDQAGIPDVSMTLSCAGGDATIALAQRRFWPVAPPSDSHEQWIVPVCVAYDDGKDRAEACTRLADATASLTLPTHGRCPAWFAPAGDFGYYRAALEPKALVAIRDKAWPELTAAERIAIFGDAWAHALTGSPPIGIALDLADKLRTDRDPLAVAVALGDPFMLGFGHGLPDGLSALLPRELVAAARARVRSNVEPLARRLGLAAAAHDTYGMALDRLDVAGATAWSGSHVLDAAAKPAAAHFRALPPGLRTNVVRIAANADPGVVDQLARELATEPDRANRDVIASALGSLPDPAQRVRVIAQLVATPTTNAEDVVELLTWGEPDTMADSAAYIRAHVAELVARMPANPEDDFPIAIRLAVPFLRQCDAAARDADAAFVHAHFANLPGATLLLRQLAEANDQCIAQKALLAPALRAWLKSR